MMVFDMSMGILALRHVATVVLCQAGAIEAGAAGVLAGYCTVGETLPVGAEKRRGKSRSGRDVKSHLAISSSSIHYIPRSLEL